MRFKAWWPAAAIVVAGLLATGLAFRVVQAADEARIRAALDLQAEWRAKDIEHKIDVAAFPVHAAATFVASQKEMRGDEIGEFRQFVVQARGNKEPIRSIAWIPRVPGDERSQFEAAAREMGLPHYRILEPGPNRVFVPAPERAEYYPVLLHVAFEGQAPVTGVDMGSEPVRRGAVLRARDTGRGAATGRFGMLTLSDDEPSYLVAYPVYKGGVVPATVEERRALFRGVVFGAFQLRRMLAAAAENTPDIRETIAFSFGQADDPPPRLPVALYSPATKTVGAVGAGGDPTATAAFRTVKTFDVMGQRWTLASGFSPEVVGALRSGAPMAVLLAGLLLTAAVGAYVAREHSQFEKVREVVAMQTADLRLSNASLRSEAERREQAEAWLRDAIEAIPEGFGLYDADDRFVMCNQRFREIRGVNPMSCVPGASFADILRAGIECGEIPVPDEGTEVWVQKRLEARKAPFSALIQKRGERWFRLSEQHMRSGGIVAIHADITELKAAQADAEAARARMTDWTMTATDWFWESDADGNLTFLSDSFETATGVRATDRLGKPRLDLLPDNQANQSKWRAHLAANASHRPFRDFVVEAKTIAQHLHMSISGKPFFDVSGRFVGYRGTSRDVTAQVEAERALARQTSTLSTLIENLPLGVVLIDRDMRIVAYNRPYFTSLSLPVDLVGVGDPIEKVLQYLAERGDYGSADVDTIVRDFMEQLRTPHPRRYETVHVDGRVIETDRRPLAGGGLVSTFTDITEKQKVARQLAQAQKMDAVGQLTGGIAHDFNNLLGIVVGNLDQQIDTLDRHPDSVEEIKDLGREALDAALRGAELVKHLLAFSRNQPLQPSVIDIGETVRQVEPLLGRALGEHVAAETRVAADLWRVNADPSQLQNVIVNLAINARDAMPDGGQVKIICANRTLDATAASSVDISAGDYVTVSVVDTGTGIPADVLPRVFEPFFTTKEVGKGSGLGLSMIYGFARQTGGGVRIYTEMGRGTEVRLYLPRAQGEVAANEAAVEPAVATTAGRERILLVEDRDEVRAMASRLLANLGYEVIAAENGVSALDMVNNGLSFDLLFTDIIMPGNLTGIELAHEVRRRHPDIPILLTSGFSDPEMLHAEASALGVQVLRKPYRKAELAEYLRTALGRA